MYVMTDEYEVRKNKRDPVSVLAYITLISNTLILNSSLNVREHVSRHIAQLEILLLYSIFYFQIFKQRLRRQNWIE